ncbi:MAG: TSUP family transporter [Alphaproteobacteria bacterium]|nr:TSUP family transporter [Alphaproteobacteria bacterium]
MSFVGGFVTAAMGIGGGVSLLAVMATLMPAAAIIPVHGVVQFGANIARGAILRADIDWRTFIYFAIGSVFGIAIGGSIVVTLPGDILRAGLALFILYTVWGPKMRFVGTGNVILIVIGLVASILTMFFGATGTFISGLLNQRGYDPKGLVATHSACMGAQHALKIVAFGILGFAFADWLGLIVLMLVAISAGTYVGSLVLNRMPARIFAIGLKTILTGLAINLLASALGLYSLV